jgi:hypothetical protein
MRVKTKLFVQLENVKVSTTRSIIRPLKFVNLNGKDRVKKNAALNRAMKKLNWRSKKNKRKKVPVEEPLVEAAEVEVVGSVPKNTNLHALQSEFPAEEPLVETAEVEVVPQVRKSRNEHPLRSEFSRHAKMQVVPHLFLIWHNNSCLSDVFFVMYKVLYLQFDMSRKKAFQSWNANVYEIMNMLHNDEYNAGIQVMM